MAVPLINGVVHSFASIRLLIAGVPIYSVESIDYKDAQAIEDVRGAGYYAVGRSFGDITYECSVTVQLADLIKLQQAAPSGRIQQLPLFDIVVSFQPFGSTVTTVHTIQNCTFTEAGVSASTGDMTIPVELPFVCSFIQFVPGAQPIA